jgi:hypothetical protein
MATQALQLVAVDRLAALLEALKAERVLKQIYYTESAISQSNDVPFAFFRLAADEEYGRDSTVGGPPRFTVRSRILVDVVIRRETTYTTRELAEMIDTLRRRITTDFPQPPGTGCRLQIVGLTTFSDPWIANLGYKDFGSATIAIDYFGTDTYD